MPSKGQAQESARRERPQIWQLPAESRVLVASDMHLGDHDPATAAWFLGQLRSAIETATHLLLLGDLFEAWAGDDTADATAQAVIERLAAIGKAVSLAVLPGNRDFLLDIELPNESSAGFAARSGATMLADPCVVLIGDTRLLVSHGDAWCTDDSEYMAFRQMVRAPAWQAEFLARSPAERIAIAKDIRTRSMARHADPTDPPGDVDPAAVTTAMRRAHTQWLVHGHTHRPAVHRVAGLDGDAARVVLPDWDAGAQRGGFALMDQSGVSVLATSRTGDPCP